MWIYLAFGLISYLIVLPISRKFRLVGLPMSLLTLTLAVAFVYLLAALFDVPPRDFRGNPLSLEKSKQSLLEVLIFWTVLFVISLFFRGKKPKNPDNARLEPNEK